MRVGACIALVLALLISPAAAQEVELGTGTICDTQQQMERVAAALKDKDAETAIEQVNAEEKNPTACIVATVAFMRGPQVATAHNGDGAYQIVKILVVGVATEEGLQAAIPEAFYTMFLVKEAEA